MHLIFMKKLFKLPVRNCTDEKMSAATHSNICEIPPEIVRRSCGGWLAMMPKGGIFTIAVTANTADEARECFRLTILRWVEILDGATNSNTASEH
jgi:hypothetical protein